jgi:hypothetical protein
MHGDELATTRRRALGALTAVGVASAGLGVGTDAVLSDVESFDRGRMSAGELDLRLAWHESVSSATTRGSESDGWPTLQSDVTPPGRTFADVKPGDSGRLTIAVRLDGSPGYLSVLGRERADAEGGQSEAETGALAESVPATREGELDELTTVRLSSLRPDDPTAPEAGGAMRPVWTASLASLVALGGVGAGVPLDGDETAGVYDLLVGDDARAPYPGGGPTRYLRLDWTPPTWVGDGVASDTFACAFGLFGVQGR